MIFGKKTDSTQKQGHEAFLDKELYPVPGTDQSITWADAVEGTLILGATGSGKTSGPGKHAALAMMNAGWGFCVLCAKTDERKRWERYAESIGRSDDVIILSKSSGKQFNFLKYEMTRQGAGAGDYLNAINTMMNMNAIGKNYQANSGSQTNSEPFWDNSLRRIISRTIALLEITGEDLSMDNMRKVVSYSLKEGEPRLYKELKVKSSNLEGDDKLRDQAKADLQAWVQDNYFLQLIERLDREIFDTEEKNVEAKFIRQYWLEELPNTGDRVHGIVIESFLGILEGFVTKGTLRDQFSAGLDEDLLPEKVIAEKKIVIVDFSTKEFGVAGIIASIIYKCTFMAAMERREIDKEENPTPCCLWIDEYQNYCSPTTDSLFQTTARSSWVATVYITQSLNNLYFVMGSNNPEARTKSLLGNLNLKYFCSNADWDTNYWASQMIGEHLTETKSINSQEDRNTGQIVVSTSKSQQLRNRVTPDHYTTLKTGRQANNFVVEAIVFKAGKVWGQDKRNFAEVEFRQN
ncbi:MAG: TraM recognition domain-containing protein [Bacteroidota bacterium]